MSENNIIAEFKGKNHFLSGFLAVRSVVTFPLFMLHLLVCLIPMLFTPIR